MAGGPEQVFFPTSYPELFFLWDNFPDAVLFAGGSGFARYPDKRVPELPAEIISLDKIDDLRRIARTERYLEIGAMVRLSEIISLGKVVPEILARTLEGIAGIHVRNTATIGGNLCEKNRRLDAAAAMTALEAHFELRNASSTRWISASRFSAVCPPALSPHEIMTRIRIPLEQWNYSLYRKFRATGSIEAGEIIVFILKTEKNTLTNLRVVYSGDLFLNNRESEALLIGKQLPLNRRDAFAFLDNWKLFLENLETGVLLKTTSIKNPEKKKLDLLKVQILNFLENAILDITD